MFKVWNFRTFGITGFSKVCRLMLFLSLVLYRLPNLSKSSWGFISPFSQGRGLTFLIKAAKNPPSLLWWGSILQKSKINFFFNISQRKFTWYKSSNCFSCWIRYQQIVLEEFAHFVNFRELDWNFDKHSNPRHKLATRWILLHIQILAMFLNNQQVLKRHLKFWVAWKYKITLTSLI